MDHTSTFRPSAALSGLMRGVETMARAHTTFDWGIAALNVPLFVLTYGIVTLSTDDDSALAKTAMPDEWVCLAAALPSASNKNLRALQHAYDKQGFVSIAAADRFCTVEFERERHAAQKAEVEAKKSAPGTAGYLALSTRLSADGFEPTVREAIESLQGYATSITKAGVGLVSFTAEAAVLAGQGLGMAANLLKKVRGNP